MTTEQTIFIYNDSGREVQLKLTRPVVEGWFFEPLIEYMPSLPLYTNRETKYKLHSGNAHIATIWINPSGDIIAIKNHNKYLCAVSFEFLFNYPCIIIINTPQIGHKTKYNRLANGMINTSTINSIDLGQLFAKKV